MAQNIIREIQAQDKNRWRELYRGYADFYQAKMNETILNTVWEWLQDETHELNGLVYETDGSIVALAHYRRMPSPIRGKDIGFLDDLFVVPEYRGRKIGEQLINRLKEISRAENWNLIRWITQENNATAKRLYDKVAQKTTWNVYELK